MSLSSVRSIWDAVHSGKFKLAGTELSKELDKNPDNAVYRGLSALLASKQGHRSKAIDEARAVVRTGPTNLVVISLLDEVLSKYKLYDDVCLIYEAADRKAPGEQLHNAWYDSMARAGSAKGLVKVSMAIQKRSPSRENALAVAFNMYQASALDAVTDKEKQLYGMLARKYVERAAPLSGIQETFVQAQVLALAKRADAAALLRDETKKHESLDLTCLLVELLEHDGQWKELYEYCSEYLTDPASMDNWVHWSRLVEAAKKLGYAEKAEKFIKTFPRPGRNSRLALVALSKGKKDKFVVAVREYYAAMSKSRCVYDDLRPYLDELDAQTWLDITAADDSAPLETRATAAKFRALVEGPSVADNVQAYLDTQHLLKGKPVTDYHPGDDFLLIAALKLMEDGAAEGLERAAVLLEIAAKGDKHQFYVRLWLVRIYLLLGAFTQALAHYHVLSIKTIQHESIAHVLLTRLSTVYPSRAPLSKVHDIYDQATEMGPYLKYAYQNGSYTRIKGLVELQNQLDRSLNEQLFNVEHARLDRLLLGGRNNPKIELPLPDTNYVDNRDFDTMFDIFPPGGLPLSRKLTVGPTPGASFVQFQAARESLLRHLMDRPVADSFEDESILGSLLDAKDITPEESLSGKAVMALAAIAKAPWDNGSYKKLTHIIDEYSSTYLVETAMGWQLVHRVLVALDMAAVAHAYLIKLRGEKAKTDAAALDSAVSANREFAKAAKDLAIMTKQVVTDTETPKRRALEEWADSLSLDKSIVGTTVSSIVNGQAQTLMQIRALKVAGN